MTRRVRCLQIGSFDCLIRGGVFDEQESLAILPYLEIAYAGAGYCIAVAHAVHDSSAAPWAVDDDEHPAVYSERVLRAHVGNRGFVYRRADDRLITLWVGRMKDGGEQLEKVFSAATRELASRHHVLLTHATGGWKRALVDAHVSLREAETILTGGFPAWISSSSRKTLCEREPVRSIQQYVLERFRDPNLTLGAIADEFGLTETYLSQLFKEQTGVNYSVFLAGIRIEAARRLLLRGDLRIATVADQVGYQINSTFYRAFRRVYGISPSAYKCRLPQTGSGRSRDSARRT